MDLPIKFPSDADVIAEEAARFRALSSTDAHAARFVVCSEAEHFMMQQSPRIPSLREYTLQQEELARQTVKEFIARHAE